MRCCATCTHFDRTTAEGAYGVCRVEAPWKTPKDIRVTRDDDVCGRWTWPLRLV